MSAPSRSVHFHRLPVKRALLVGINYLGSTMPLGGPQRDAHEVFSLLTDSKGYKREDVTMMLDVPSDSPEYATHLVPTRENILREIDLLVKDAHPGDRLVFYFAGHSAQIENEDGTEEDGLDEYIIPVDRENIILDDELKVHLVDPLAAGSSLVAIFDTCHSGSILDLPHRRCNQVYVPWMFRGHRKTGSRCNFLTRRNAYCQPSVTETRTEPDRKDERKTPSPRHSLRVFDHKRVNRQRSVTRMASIDVTLGETTTTTTTTTTSSTTSTTSGASGVVSAETVASALSTSTFSKSKSSKSSSRSSEGKAHTETRRKSSFGWMLPSPQRCMSPEPLVASLCDGHCRERIGTRVARRWDSIPHVACISAAKDSQLACDGDGMSMTLMLVKCIRTHPEMSLRDTMTQVSHDIHKVYIRLHQRFHAWKKANMNKKTPSGSWPEGYPVLDEDSFQNPQTSSLEPLDMDAPLEL